MQTQSISAKQGIMVMVLFLLGTTFLMVMGLDAGKDLWLSYLIAFAVSMALMFVCARILSYIPGQDIYGIMDALLGKGWTRVILVFMAVFLFQFASYVMRNFAQFIDVAGLPDVTPIVPFISIGFVAVLAVYAGIENLGRWSELLLPLLALFIIVSALLLTRRMDLDHLRPVLENGWAPVGKGAWAVISFPFAQAVAVLFVLPPFQDKKTPFKVFPLGLLFGAALVFISSMQDVLVLGVEAARRLHYPSYSTLSIIRIGEFIQRLEIVAATIFTLAVFVKLSVLIMAACKAIAHILGLDDHRFLAFPVALLAINYGTNAFGDSLQFTSFTYVVWPYYSSIFQILIPVLIFLLLELMASRQKRKQLESR